MTRLYLIRHGQTDWNRLGRWQGHVDMPLNWRGLVQARQMAHRLEGVDFSSIYSSNLQRARQTADALAQVSGLQVHLDARLRELHMGEWQGIQVNEARRRFRIAWEQADGQADGFAPPGGESLRQVRERLAAAVGEIGSRHAGQRVAVVTHGFAVAMLQAHFQGVSVNQAWDLIPDNDQWVEIEVESGL
jgi:broad specificity phosphatase PhoE